MRWWKAPEMAFLDRRLQRLPASLFRLWFNMNCVASWSGGKLPDLADVAFLLRTSPAALARRIGQLQEAGLLAIGEGGEITVVGAIETEPRAHDDRPAPLSAAERTRRWRESRRERDARDEAGDDAVTPVTRLEEETDKRDSDSSRVTRGERDEPFNLFWSAYPSRDGDNPRQPAEAAFRKAIEAGANPKALVEGARRYAASTAGRERRFVASAARWLGEGRWKDDRPAPTISTPAAEAPGVWIAAGSPEWSAWETYRGKSLPRDARNGWHVPSLTPPAVEAAA